MRNLPNIRENIRGLNKRIDKHGRIRSFYSISLLLSFTNRGLRLKEGIYYDYHKKGGHNHAKIENRIH